MPDEPSRRAKPVASVREGFLHGHTQLFSLAKDAPNLRQHFLPCDQQTDRFVDLVAEEKGVVPLGCFGLSYSH